MLFLKKMDILHQRELAKLTLLRLSRKLLMKEDEFDRYVLNHLNDLEKCIRCHCFLNNNKYGVVLQVIDQQIYELRVQIEREFQKYIAPNLELYVDACCGKVLVEVKFSKIMFELIFLHYRRRGDLKIQDWSEFGREVVSYERYEIR